MSVAYIGIGSNLGDRKKNIDSALEKLGQRKGVQVSKVSSLIETDPVGDINQPKFLNAAARLDTALYPDELLDALKSIERELGRGGDSRSQRLSPQEQLKLLQEGKVEEIYNMKRGESAVQEKQAEPKNSGPRTIDLDILFYDDVILKGNNLTIPHPLLHTRLFVLKPLAEIAPDFIHPVLNKNIRDLLSECR